MRTRDFFASLLPNTGFIMLAHPWEGGGFNNTPVSTISEALDIAAHWAFEQLDVYFAMSTFKQARVWNETKLNPRTTMPGVWERRTKANAYAIQCLFLDLDVKDDDKHYHSQEDAYVALRTLCQEVNLPKPTVVDSGYGLHAYWPLLESVSPEEWEPVAQRLKAVCVAQRLLIDTKITADAARVLRVPGTYNFKRGDVRDVTVLQEGKPETLGVLAHRLREFVENHDVVETRTRKVVPIIAVPFLDEDVPNNIGTTNDPLCMDMLVFGCPALAKQVATRGRDASEPEWRAALGLTRFCEPQRPAMLAVSDGHSAFDADAMVQKVANWTGGPSKCAAFWEEDHDTCEGCQFWGRITSPAQVGRTIREAPEPTIEITQSDGTVMVEKRVPLPAPYKRRVEEGTGKVTIVFKTEDAEGNVAFETICPYDLYPVRILRQTDNENVDESSVWRMTLPQLGDVDVNIPQSLLADQRATHTFLMKKGMYLNANEAKSTQFYMSAYLKSLSEATARDKVYDRLGWHDDHRTFVLPDTIMYADGSQQPHVASRAIKAITKGAMHEEGVFDMWLDAMDFYQGAGNAGYRFFVYCSFAAPIFYLTGHKGVLVAASGDTGRGKSTALEACGSVWGDPEPLLVSGGSDGTTTNALYSIIGTYHSLPLLWDETTEREADEMRRFLLNISQGKGKERMKGNEHDGRVVTWETIVCSSANTDDVSRIVSSGKDSDPHLMRMVSVEFDAIDRSTDAKLRADEFKRKIREHYGHAGRRFMRYVIDNRDDIRRLLIRNMREIDQRSHASSHERYWTATIAAAYTAAQIATRIGVLRYDYKADLRWMQEHITRMRTTFVEARTSPVEVISEFLEANTASTLVISVAHGHNISNIAVRPTRSLLVRHEMDAGIIYIARGALMEYCNVHKANFRKLEHSLVDSGAILSKSCQKILGADTPYAKGQSRCWKLLESKLDGSVTKNIHNAIAQQQSVPVRK